MTKKIIFIIVIILILIIITYKNEFFTNSTNSTDSTKPIQLSDADLSNIKKSIDDIAAPLFIEAKNNLGDENIKILIDSFIKITELPDENKKDSFNKNAFVHNIFIDKTISLSENFKQSLYLELFEAYVLGRNLNIIPIRLIASEKITNVENIKKIKDKLYTHLQNISDTFILLILKYYDYLPAEIDKRFDSSIISRDEINNLIAKNPILITPFTPNNKTY